ncbi:MAG TPA: hypothetical protein VNZ49_01490 [Bacteroidia bacterium]|jgi:hypothetical protein|nr:hypothetical protein [Bacteroidia bacterium]
MLVLEKITLSFAEFSLLKDNIVLIDYLNEEPLNVERGIQLVETINKLTCNKPSAAIHNVGDKYIFTTDALRFMGSQLSTNEHNYSARALVVTNPAARIASNNFINSYKPLIPTRIFNEVEEALAWVEGLLAQAK